MKTKQGSAKDIPLSITVLVLIHFLNYTEPERKSYTAIF